MLPLNANLKPLNANLKFFEPANGDILEILDPAHVAHQHLQLVRHHHLLREPWDPRDELDRLHLFVCQSLGVVAAASAYPGVVYHHLYRLFHHHGVHLLSYHHHRRLFEHRPSQAQDLVYLDPCRVGACHPACRLFGHFQEEAVPDEKTPQARQQSPVVSFHQRWAHLMVGAPVAVVKRVVLLAVPTEVGGEVAPVDLTAVVSHPVAAEGAETMTLVLQEQVELMPVTSWQSECQQ